MSDSKHLETLAVHAGRGIDPTTGAVAPPLHLSTTFERDADGGYRRGFDYLRDAHPTRQILEQALAALEGGGQATAFASGSAASLAVFHAVGPGAHIVCSHDAYHGTVQQLQDVVSGWGSTYSLVDTTSLSAVAAAMRDDTTLLWIETPSNPLLRISDIAALAALAHEHGARAAVDNTFATPVLQNPLAHGADIVMHSSTKYLGGHSDLCGGAVVTRDKEFSAALRTYQSRAGSMQAPFDSWLLLRSLNTLPLRVRAQSAGAQELAGYLADHPRVSAAIYPTLTTHPDHELAQRQMRTGGAMLSFRVREGQAAALEVAARVRLFTRATSLGGVESLIEHRASVEGPDTQTPDDLLRVSVGLEHPQDLIADLEHALDA